MTSYLSGSTEKQYTSAESYHSDLQNFEKAERSSALNVKVASVEHQKNLKDTIRRFIKIGQEHPEWLNRDTLEILSCISERAGITLKVLAKPGADGKEISGAVDTIQLVTVDESDAPYECSKEPRILPLTSGKPPEPLLYDEIIHHAIDFAATLSSGSLPKLANRQTALEQIQGLYSKDVVETTLQSTRPLVHERVLTVIDEFLKHKLIHGAKQEKALYAAITQEQFIDRLLKKRPLVFWLSDDEYVSRDLESGAGGFEAIGTDEEKAPLVLEKYLSYDEMQISSLLGVSAHTRFINDGARSNAGSIGNSGTYEKEGICVALVGARFEKPGLMEYEFNMVTPSQNTSENGFGPLPHNPIDDNPKQSKMRIWATFYGVTHFPTFKEAMINPANFKIMNEGLLSKELYKKRIKINIELFLAEANSRAQATGRSAYAQPYGWGLSAWTKHPIQKLWFLEAFTEVLKELHLPHISDVDFSFVVKGQPSTKEWSDYRKQDQNVIKGIRLHYPHEAECRDLCSKFKEEHNGKLLVNSYGWDGNSYPGNEYWLGALTASGDPAMMCASPLQLFAQVPDINPLVSGNNAHMVTF